MEALLRHLYGLPYAANRREWHDGATLGPHVLVYTTAEKYRIPRLKTDSYTNIKNILHLNRATDVRALGWITSSNYISALRQLHADTTASDGEARDLLIAFCVSDDDRMRALINSDAFMQLITEVPQLGVDFFAHIYKDGSSVARIDVDFCEHCKAMTPVACFTCRQRRSPTG